MTAWADDPELLATFRAEVQDRLASLTAGLLRLERHPSPRHLVASLFRDAHTVKGSARMLGLDAVVDVAHRCEDLLGGVREGRIGVTSGLVDLLLVAVDGISRSLPGGDRPLLAADLVPVLAALDASIAGTPDALPVLPDLPGAFDGAGDVPLPPKESLHASVRVPSRRVHDLLDVVGEAELDVRRVARHGADLRAVAAEAARTSRDLRAGGPATSLTGLVALADRLVALSGALGEEIETAGTRLDLVRSATMGLAMVPLRRVVHAFPALVRDVAGRTGKDVRLELVGEDVELDTRVLDAVADALGHLVTNAVDHGVETAADRIFHGKPATATVTVSARAAGAGVVVEVSDDGRGIDEDALRAAAVTAGLLPEASLLTGPPLWRLLFAGGLSTRDEVTSTSGRGVGLDVVRAAAEGLGGSVDIESTPGQGTRFVLTLPVTVGILRCLVAAAGGERYALALPGIVETFSLGVEPVYEVAGAPCVERHGRAVPLFDLATALGAPRRAAAADRPAGSGRRSAVVVRHGADELLAWAVDRLEDERELVVKDFGGFLGRVPFVSGATIDTDGSVLLVVDLRELAAAAGDGPVGPTATAVAPVAALVPGQRAPSDQVGPPRILLVEDSVGVRELQRVILEGAGYLVTTAVDGLDGAGHLGGEAVDLVLTDVEMPGMDGFTLTRTLRRTRGWENVPVVVMTSRGDEADRRAGLDAGASAYLLKSEFDQEQLLHTVRRLIGRAARPESP